ncbi:MAG: trehalose-phosphatase [Rhodospirillales bacterium]|jgi:trehalose 6-phosphate phosphatase|nr:trehalose-phosphatase [Rhodospirillales bacterium]
MRAVNPMLDPFAPLSALVEAPPRPAADQWALFLDVDGTLIDLAPTPDAVVVPDGLIETLDSLSRRLGGALALVSGRALGTLDGLFAPWRFAGAGQHGGEVRLTPHSLPIVHADAQAVAIATARLEMVAGTLPGVFVEPKGVSTAIHFRQAPQAESAIRAALPRVLAGLETRLEASSAKMAFDIRTRGLTKGTAISVLCSIAPFAGRTPVMVGDDRTDEDGFAEAAARGGAGVLVGTPRATLAHWRLDSPNATRTWLETLARAPAANE